MAVRTVPAGCYLQPTDTASIDTSGKKDYAYEVKGLYSDLETWKNTFVYGTDTFNDRVISTSTLRRVAGDAGVLSINLVDADSVQGNESVAYKGTWSFRAARNDVSIYAYCGSAASRIKLEMWQKETNASLADEYKFKDDYLGEVSLNNVEQAIAMKIKQGRESVIRFYPILTYTCYYRSCPAQWAVDIGLIRTPAAAAADRIIAPSNINDVIGGFVWLKVQDDVEETPGDGYKRTMSWWGIRSSDGGWDTDFYGPNRWQMPIQSGNQ